MKICLDVEDKHFEYEANPLPPERFSAVCKLVGTAIGGAVGALALVGGGQAD